MRTRWPPAPVPLAWLRTAPGPWEGRTGKHRCHLLRTLGDPLHDLERGALGGILETQTASREPEGLRKFPALGASEEETHSTVSPCLLPTPERGRGLHPVLGGHCHLQGLTIYGLWSSALGPEHPHPHPITISTTDLWPNSSHVRKEDP